MANTEEILKAYRLYVAEYTELADEAILPTTTLEDLGLDSLEEVEMTMFLEDTYNVDLLEDAIDFETVGEFIDAILKQLETKNG